MRVVNRQIAKDFGVLLKLRRKASGRKVMDLCAGVGVGRIAWYQYERGITMPGTIVLVRICNKLDISLSELTEIVLRDRESDATSDLDAWSKT